MHNPIIKLLDLKEEYLLFNQTPRNSINPEELRKDLTEIIYSMKSSGVREFRDMSRTLNRYKNEILNSFVWFGYRRISNGPIEGKNTYIKKSCQTRMDYKILKEPETR